MSECDKEMKLFKTSGRQFQSCKNNSDRFLFRSHNFSQQFAHVYAFRLKHMTKLLRRKALEKWGFELPIKQLCDLREDLPEQCIIIGTLFKHQPLKPSILREISEENQLILQPPRNSYVDYNDKLIIEDELQRIRIIEKMDVHYVVTGIVCAILGYVEADGKFIVENYMFYEGGIQRQISTLRNSPLVVLISGLHQWESQSTLLSLELFQQWLCGNIYSDEEKSNWDPSNVVRVILCGNSVNVGLNKDSQDNQNSQTEDIHEIIQTLDEMFFSWCQSVPVDVMPGDRDPSNFMFPQQPFHSCLFPKSSNLSSFKRVTNPYDCEIDGTKIMGTSGQNIQDIMKASQILQPIEALQCSLKWSHIAPTSPDTLPCYPYMDTDPFIIEDCPHIYFSGNHADFETSLYEGEDKKIVRLVCVPSFKNTHCVALVNLRTLDCLKMSFNAECFQD